MVISGEKKSESEKKEKSWHVVERSYGSFRRVVPLTFVPEPDKIKATFDKGVLHVSVRKPAGARREKGLNPHSECQMNRTRRGARRAAGKRRDTEET
jgi:HSP20 family molecular chaperone IbpA